MPKKRTRKRGFEMPPDTKRLLESMATSGIAEQQRRDEQTDALYKAAINELLTQEPPPASGVDQIINQGLVDALVQRFAEILAGRFKAYVANQLQLTSREEQRETLQEVFGLNGKDR
jgi:hypothetical protein